jgi:hypothetical protein
MSISGISGVTAASLAQTAPNQTLAAQTSVPVAARPQPGAAHHHHHGGGAPPASGTGTGEPVTATAAASGSVDTYA